MRFYPGENGVFLGLDLGQSRDFSAVAVVERHGHLVNCTNTFWKFDGYRVRHLFRFPLGTSYVSIGRDVANLQRQPELTGSGLAVDHSGVGRAVSDILEEEGVKRMTRVTMSGGAVVNEISPNEYSVPKRELYSVLHSLFHKQQIKINPSLPFADQLRSEIGSFQLKITLSGHDSYESATEADHDDLLDALALACWLGEYDRHMIRPSMSNLPI